MIALHCFALRQHGFDALQASERAGYCVDFPRIVAIHPCDASITAMVLEVFVPIDGNRDANRMAAPRAGFLEIPAPRLMVHAMIRCQQEGGVGGGGSRLAEKLVQPCQVLV